MKSTGIVRKVDELGRIVLPIELRRTLDIAERDALEIYVDGASIILQKYEPACIFCGDAKDVVTYKGRNICANCLKEMQSGSSRDDVEDAPVSVDESTIGLNSVSTMDEIIPEIEEDIPANEYGDIQNELSLESVIEDENEDDDEDKDDDDR